MIVADWGWFDMWHLSASPSCDFTSLFHTLWSDGASFLRANALRCCWRVDVCLDGNSPIFLFLFSPPFHSTLSLAIPLSSIAVMCRCLCADASSSSSLSSLSSFFAPSLKHPPLFCSSVLFLSTGEFSSTLPPLFLVYQPPPILPPPLLPLSLPAAFPKKSTCYRHGLWIAQGWSCHPLTLWHSSCLMHVGAFSPVVPRRHVVSFQDYFQRITNRAMYLMVLECRLSKFSWVMGAQFIFPGGMRHPFCCSSWKKDDVKLVNNRAHLHSAHIFSHFPPHRVLYCRS